MSFLDFDRTSRNIKSKDESATHLIFTIWEGGIEMVVRAFFPNHVPEPAESIPRSPRNG